MPMWLVLADALLCLAVPGAARWTVVGIDRDTGEDIAMPEVRFRWRRSARAWITGWWIPHVPPGAWVGAAVRPLPNTGSEAI